MKRLKIYSIAVFVIFIAGIIGVQLQGSHTALYITDIYYREACKLEKEFPWVDMLNITSDEGRLIYILRSLKPPTQEEWSPFVEKSVASMERLQDAFKTVVVLIVSEGPDGSMWVVFHAEYDLQSMIDNVGKVYPKSMFPFSYPLFSRYVKWPGNRYN